MCKSPRRKPGALLFSRTRAAAYCLDGVAALHPRPHTAEIGKENEKVVPCRISLFTTMLPPWARPPHHFLNLLTPSASPRLWRNDFPCDHPPGASLFRPQQRQHPTSTGAPPEPEHGSVVGPIAQVPCR